MPQASKLDYDANTYLAVTISDARNPSTLQSIHPAVTYIGQVGQLRDIHRLCVAKQDWEQKQEEITETLMQAGIIRIDVEKLQQRAKRTDHDEL
jgi:hypothetical protein